MEGLPSRAHGKWDPLPTRQLQSVDGRPQRLPSRRLGLDLPLCSFTEVNGPSMSESSWRRSVQVCFSWGSPEKPNQQAYVCGGRERDGESIVTDLKEPAPTIMDASKSRLHGVVAAGPRVLRGSAFCCVWDFGRSDEGCPRPGGRSVPLGLY